MANNPNPDRDIEYVIISLSKVSIQEAIDEKTVRLYELDDITDQEIDKIKLLIISYQRSVMNQQCYMIVIVPLPEKNTTLSYSESLSYLMSFYRIIRNRKFF